MPPSAPLSSMTGFARAEGATDDLSWVWEAKSVNGKGLDLRCRLTGGFDGLEPRLRQAAQRRMARGNLQIALTLERSAALPRVQVNEELLARYLAVAQSLVEKGAAAPSADGLLSLRGVLETAEGDGSQDKAAQEALLLADAERLLDALVAARIDEGVGLAAVLTERLDALAATVARASDLAAVQPDALRARLARQVEELLAASSGLPAERLAQEAALLAVKADLREEIERLGAHIAAARALLAEGGPVGRRLDFLCQELNREANTLCSKAQDLALTEAGLEMKSIIDQLREQVQNLE